VEDLLRFTDALPKLVSPAAYRELVPEGAGVGWAGGFPGVSTMVSLGGGTTIIALSNYDPPAAMEVAQNIRRVLPTSRQSEPAGAR
jgi:hypothetical protein